MDSLKDTVHRLVSGYARKGLNGQSYLTQSDDGLILSVISVARVQGKHISGVNLVVRILGEAIIVERDQNDKPLVDALLQAGIPRSQIILAYAREPVPETV